METVDSLKTILVHYTYSIYTASKLYRIDGMHLHDTNTSACIEIALANNEPILFSNTRAVYCQFMCRSIAYMNSCMGAIPRFDTMLH